MKKTSYIITMPYTYEPERKGAKYLIGESYKNHGEFVESVLKHHRGLDYIVNPNTSYDTGSDIESEHMSVKSDRASLAAVYGETKNEILKEFFAKCASEYFTWAYDKENEMTEYTMTKAEFYEFCIEFGSLGRESSDKTKSGYKVRFNSTTKAMLQWFETKMVVA